MRDQTRITVFSHRRSAQRPGRRRWRSYVSSLRIYNCRRARRELLFDRLSSLRDEFFNPLLLFFAASFFIAAGFFFAALLFFEAGFLLPGRLFAPRFLARCLQPRLLRLFA